MKSNFVTKVITAAGVLAVLFYFGYSILSYLADPLATAIAYDYRSDEAVTVSGFLVRQEQVLTGGDGQVYVTRSEGERVAAGGSVAVLFHSREALEQTRELQRQEDQLEQLQFAQSVTTGSQQVLKLDSSIMDSIFAIRSAAVREDLGAISGQTGSLQAMILKRDYTYSGVGEDQLQQQIDQLQQEIRSLRSTARSGSSRITTDRAGYFSALVDGYETVLTPDSLETMTPSALRALRPEAVSGGSVGKMVHGSTWYYATAMKTADMGKLAVGDTVTIRFMSGLEKEIRMEVFSIGEEEGGERLVVLSCDRYLSITTLLRHQNAQIIYHSYNGIRVPKGAVRVVTDTVADENGVPEELRVTGVYCRMGLVARLKPVQVLYEGEDYYLVRPDTDSLAGMADTQREIRILRGGDEVILSARDLYDGKVIGQ